MPKKPQSTPSITFLTQGDPPDEYGRALYAVVRSLLRAFLDGLGKEDLEDIQTDKQDVTLRQLAKVARLDRDKGQRGDGFEWAVHEALMGEESRVTELVGQGLARASRYIGKGAKPSSVMFGVERAKLLGFTDAVVDEAGVSARLLPDGVGRPFSFGPWVRIAAKGHTAERELAPRISKIWKTDLFLSDQHGERYLATTIKSQVKDLEGGPGLRMAIVPETARFKAGVRWSPKHGLWTVSLPDPDGFMGLFNDAYRTVAETIYKLGKHTQTKYWSKPSAKGERIQAQLEKAATATVLEVEDALNEAAQQNLVSVQNQLVPVQAPPWLHLGEAGLRVVAPKPRFESVD